MTRRTLTTTLSDDWRGALRAAGNRASARSYQGEVLNFETAEGFFGRLTERRWALVHALQQPMPIRELARRLGRDVRRVHDDVEVLAELRLVERTDAGGVHWPYETVHVDSRMTAADLRAA